MTDPSQYVSGRTVQEQMNELIQYVDVRSAEVATDAIASDVAQVHQDMLDADADASAAAASAAAAAGTLANAVKKTGESSQSIAGDVAVAGTLSGGVVTGTQVTVPTPANNTDAANKKYVDDADALKISITDVNTYAVGLTGNQEYNGIKNPVVPQHGGYRTEATTLPGAAGEFVRIARMNSYSQVDYEIHATTPNNALGYARIIVGGSDQYNRSYCIHKFGTLANVDFYKVSSSGKNELWMKKTANTNAIVVVCVFSTTTFEHNVMAATGLTSAPSIGDTNPITNVPITGVDLIT